MKMKVLPILLLASPVLLVLHCGKPASTNTDNPPLNSLSTEEAAAGWKLLFDGETLNGWEDPAQESPAGDAWVVEDHCIKAVDHPRLREDLFTLQTFGDFELVFDWKISPGGNSGVKYRIQDRAVLVKGKTNPEAKRFEDVVDYELEHRTADRSQLGPDDQIEEYVVAYEYQLIDNAGHPDARQSTNRQAGSVYSMVAPAEDVTRPVGEFNRSRIVLRGNHVEHWLNGRKVLEADLDSEDIRAGLEKRWTKDSPVYKLLTEMPRKETPIGLQHHNDEVWFRNIKIRPLD